MTTLQLHTIREGSAVFWCYFGFWIKFFRVLNDHIHWPHCRCWYCQRPKRVLPLFFIFLGAMPRGLWDVISPTRDWTLALSSELGYGVLTPGPPETSPILLSLRVIPTLDRCAWAKASCTSGHPDMFHTQAVTEPLAHFSRVKCNLIRLKKTLCCFPLHLCKEGKKKKNLPKEPLSIKEEGR